MALSFRASSPPTTRSELVELLQHTQTLPAYKLPRQVAVGKIGIHVCWFKEGFFCTALGWCQCQINNSEFCIWVLYERIRIFRIIIPSKMPILIGALTTLAHDVVHVFVYVIRHSRQCVFVCNGCVNNESFSRVLDHTCPSTYRDPDAACTCQIDFLLLSILGQCSLFLFSF